MRKSQRWLQTHHQMGPKDHLGLQAHLQTQQGVGLL